MQREVEKGDQGDGERKGERGALAVNPVSGAALELDLLLPSQKIAFEFQVCILSLSSSLFYFE